MGRWSEEEYARFVRHGPGGAVTEAALQSAIRRLAQQYGWLCWHAYSSKRSPEGFPDLVLAKMAAYQDGTSPIICAELKTLTGQLTKPQEAWLEAIAGSTGVVSAVWRPSDLEAIVALLRQ